MAKLKSDLTKIAQQAPRLANQALHQTANDIISLTKQLAPIDTGALQRSYKVNPVSDTTIQVGSDIDYAPFVEFGTVNQTSQPHLTPAFHQSEGTFKARLKQAIENGS